MTAYFTQPVVCDTGPLVGLVRANLGWLPTRIFPSVLVPEAVVAELFARDSADQEQIARALAATTILPLRTAPDPLLAAELDLGESAVIQLAREQNLTGVLLDEKKARRVATLVYHLEVRGTAALLVGAKRRSLIASVGEALNAMHEGGYFIGRSLRSECLRLAGESSLG